MSSLEDAREYKGRKDGLLEVECWCQHRHVLVTPEDVRNGRTGSAATPASHDAGRPPDGVRIWLNAILVRQTEVSSATRYCRAQRESPGDVGERPGALASTCSGGTDVNDDSPPTPLDLGRIHRDWAMWVDASEADDLVAILVAEVERLRTLCPHDLHDDFDPAYDEEVEFRCPSCGAQIRGTYDCHYGELIGGGFWSKVEVIG